MALLDLWNKSPDQVRDKQIQQLIAFAGTGKLLDGSDCSTELRAYLAMVPSSDLSAYANQCLAQSFTDSGLALQDVVNEIGTRLGADVAPGRYRGKASEVGFDGMWAFPNGHSIVIEVKTTDAYRIDLNTIAGYRRSLVEEKRVKEEASSMLLIVGRQDTGDLEAQIRGSRFAWNLRIISVDALIRLMVIKEEVEDPKIIQRIHNILIPREFTRLDEIADVLFSAAEDIWQDPTPAEEVEPSPQPKTKEPKFTPVAFHDACIARVQPVLGLPLVRRTRATYSSPDKSMVVTCAVSKEYNPETHPGYWYAFHPHQREFLKSAGKAYIIFGCGSSARILLIPFGEFDPWVAGMSTTEREDRSYWHVIIERNGDQYSLRRKKGEMLIDLTRYRVPDDV